MNDTITLSAADRAVLNATDAALLRFWSHVALPNANGCMLWRLTPGADGYGRWTVSDTITDRPCRTALVLSEGPPPFAGAHAAHACGIPLCAAPAHLSWSTAAENAADKHRHGTHRTGERHPSSRVTDAEVLEIVALVRAGVQQRWAARRFGLSQQHVSAIMRGITRSDITGIPRTFAARRTPAYIANPTVAARAAA